MKWNPTLYQTKHAFVFDYGESLIELLAPQSTERILDLGCGTGELTAQINALCREIIGMDQSADMITSAQEQFNNIDFVIGDAAHFQLEKPFDAIFSNATLHWVKNYQAAIESMWNNLKDGGRIVVEFGGKGNVETIVNGLKKVLQERGHHRQAGYTPWYFPSIGEYSTALEAVGFHVTFAQHYDRPTKLVDPEKGVKDWILMFGHLFFEGLAEQEIGTIAEKVQADVAPKLLKDDHLFADYKRIRIIANKK